MTREEKDLVLHDLCARLPYRVIGEYSWKGNEPYNRELTGSLFDELKSSWDSTEDSEFLPYLRPMSSMTEEEKKEYQSLCVIHSDHDADDNVTYYYFDTVESFDYLNKNMFDYRGLIDKDLALSTEIYNPYYKD
jgi:hypothetical protein